MPQYLGLDSSTQSLSALLIDTDTGQVVAERNVNFGQRLPQYKSPNGFLPNPDPAIKHSDPLMWVEALDLVLQDLRDAGVDLGKVRGISGAGQQHGSVYLASRSTRSADWSPAAPLAEQVRPLLSRKTSPIWMDSSTSAECAEIAPRGRRRRAASPRSPGSRATLRFTGPQIRRFYKTSPAEWQRTAEIHLVSSFMASLLAGKSAPIDLGDGAGMNLLDLATGGWSDALLDATAPGLRAEAQAARGQHHRGRRDRPATSSRSTASPPAPRSSPSPATTRAASSAWAPASPEPPSSAWAPATPCSPPWPSAAHRPARLRQRVRQPGRRLHVAGLLLERLAGARGDRQAASACRGTTSPAAIVEKTKPGNGGNLLLPYFVPEITPRVLKAGPRWFGSDDFVAGKDGAAAARAVVEAQAISMRLHSDWIGEKMHTILVTGGASRNRGLLRVLADVFQATIMPLSVSNSSALGGALRAAQAVGGHRLARALSTGSARPSASLAVTPDPSTRPVYEELAADFAKRLGQI